MGTSPGVRTLKIVVRCSNFEASRDFYARILRFVVRSEWQEPEGRGCIFALEAGKDGGLLEIYEMSHRDRRFDESFKRPLGNDKIDVQLETGSVDSWIQLLSGHWPFEGPETLPWGQRWVRLRDPDNLLIAIYENLPEHAG